MSDPTRRFIVNIFSASVSNFRITSGLSSSDWDYIYRLAFDGTRRAGEVKTILRNHIKNQTFKSFTKDNLKALKTTCYLSSDAEARKFFFSKVASNEES